nr:hypothetical protein [uncultured Desulfobacter sp.]
MTEPKLCTLQPTYVIIEQIHPKAGLPSAVGGTIGPGLYQLYRRVIQVCDVHDIFFDGKHMSNPPGAWQYIQEFLMPGKQITSHPTGEKQFVRVYAGFKNLLNPLPKVGSLFPDSWTKQYDLGAPPSPFVYGNDPIPSVKLYGNPQAIFEMVGGAPPPVSVGVYNRANNQLTFPNITDRRRVLSRLIQPEPSRN